MLRKGTVAASIGVAVLLAAATGAFADSDIETIATANKAPYGRQGNHALHGE